MGALHTNTYIHKGFRYMYILYCILYTYNSVKVPHHRPHRSPLPLIRYASVQVHRGWQSHKSVCIHSVKNRLFKFRNVFAFLNYRSKFKSNRKTLGIYDYIPIYCIPIRMCVSIHVTYVSYTVYYAYIMYGC